VGVKILVIGGTQFVGRYAVEAALAAGHEVTTFNRGKTNPGLWPEVEELHGDRDGDLSALEGRTWDAVIDSSGYVPRIVRQSAELLKDAVDRYVFVSTLAVYSDLSVTDPYGEDAELAVLTEPDSEEVMKHYGALKVECEKVLDEVYGERVTHVRCGFIVGPHDVTDRFVYWPERVADGGRVLAPGDPDAPQQMIDVRDLGAFLVKIAEQGLGGPVNTTGPDYDLTTKDMLEKIKRGVGSDAEFVWVDTAALEAQDVKPWGDIPFWQGSGAMRGIMRADIARAVSFGLTFRPLEDTARDTVAWSRSPEFEHKPMLPREREAELLSH
jgi:2'-hydroxyisoflavone reductase